MTPDQPSEQGVRSVPILDSCVLYDDCLVTDDEDVHTIEQEVVALDAASRRPALDIAGWRGEDSAHRHRATTIRNRVCDREEDDRSPDSERRSLA